eukprot:TRINITY_DN17034_c0_g1_i1.p1 TRINITY_DN17034_c0_g1~~TRINITY_DN17034_c0_g1_i1.p1  ORF type:complete len:414 (-),score=60.65 TRINITY_DN17034_c0_g1_i1:378-1619(-)
MPHRRARPVPDDPSAYPIGHADAVCSSASRCKPGSSTNVENQEWRLMLEAQWRQFSRSDARKSPEESPMAKLHNELETLERMVELAEQPEPVGAVALVEARLAERLAALEENQAALIHQVGEMAVEPTSHPPPSPISSPKEMELDALTERNISRIVETAVNRSLSRQPSPGTMNQRQAAREGEEALSDLNLPPSGRESELEMELMLAQVDKGVLQSQIEALEATHCALEVSHAELLSSTSRHHSAPRTPQSPPQRYQDRPNPELLAARGMILRHARRSGQAGSWLWYILDQWRRNMCLEGLDGNTYPLALQRSLQYVNAAITPMASYVYSSRLVPSGVRSLIQSTNGQVEPLWDRIGPNATRQLRALDHTLHSRIMEPVAHAAHVATAPVRTARRLAHWTTQRIGLGRSDPKE